MRNVFTRKAGVAEVLDTWGFPTTSLESKVIFTIRQQLSEHGQFSSPISLHFYFFKAKQATSALQITGRLFVCDRALHVAQVGLKFLVFLELPGYSDYRCDARHCFLIFFQFLSVS